MYREQRATEIHKMILRGVMPPLDELRSGQNVLALGCPERLLRSVVEKNAVETRARANGNVEVRKGGDFYFPSFGDMQRKADRDHRKQSAATTDAEILRRKQFHNRILGL